MNVLISIGKNADPTNYIQAVTQAGGKAHAEYLPDGTRCFDALLLAGGGDISPDLYGQKNCGSLRIDPHRDRRELALLEDFVRAGKPVLGICRGHQLVNIWAGGGLLQDLGEQNSIHQWEGCDKIHLISADGLTAKLYGPLFRVNSAHHQSVGPVGRGLRVCARAADGVIEAMEHGTLPIFTVQFHPERMGRAGTPSGGRIFRWFVENAARV